MGFDCDSGLMLRLRALRVFNRFSDDADIAIGIELPIADVHYAPVSEADHRIVALTDERVFTGALAAVVAVPNLGCVCQAMLFADGLAALTLAE